ncbi:MAG TPA: methyltransferase domain-containing protein [Nitrososphaeraceae archaeon]|nr:methyltransferase domain-containing protein [Nitrososphaeraceae archaeon]
MKEDILKDKIREKYSDIAISGNSDCCCTPQDSCNTIEFNPKLSSISIGYDNKELESIPESSILGVGCGAPVNFADLKEGDTVLDLGSGAGIDAFLASNLVKESGKVIGIDFTHEMLLKARKAAVDGFKNVEFKQGDIETNIPVEDSSVDVAISNCVINLTRDKEKTFKEIYRILKKGGKGRMVISDLITSKEIQEDSLNPENWCKCIDGALTKVNYLNSIKAAGFQDIEILSEQPYLDEKDGRKITSLVIRAVTS